jgi:hypothetical protein
MGKRSKRRKAGRRRKHLREQAESEALPQNRRGEWAETPTVLVKIAQWPPIYRTW